MRCRVLVVAGGGLDLVAVNATRRFSTEGLPDTYHSQAELALRDCEHEIFADCLPIPDSTFAKFLRTLDVPVTLSSSLDS